MSHKAEKPAEIYTDPQLRQRLKDEIQTGDKGGKSGQWSARKSRLLVHEYEKAGGGYLSEKRTESQKDLHEWTEQDWTTSDGKVAIRGAKTERYLPREAWEKLSAAEKREANGTKEKESKHGEQFVENTEAVQRVMREIRDRDDQ